MGSRTDCDIQLRTKFAKELSPKEMDKISELVVEIAEKSKAAGGDMREDVRTFFNEHKRKVQSSKAKKVMTAETNKTLIEGFDKFPGRPEQYIESLLTFNSKTQNGHGTLWRLKSVIGGDTVAPLHIAFKDNPGMRQGFEKNEYSRDIMKLLSGDKVDEAKIHPHAITLSHTLRKMYDYGWKLKNQAGFAVRYLPNYAGKQLHPLKNIMKLGSTLEDAKLAWNKIAVDVFDPKALGVDMSSPTWQLTMEGKLDGIFDNMMNREARGVQLTDDLTSLLFGGGNAMEFGRKMPFKSGAHMAKYYDALDINYAEQVMRDMLDDSGKIAAGTQFGPNFEQSFKKLLDEGEKKAFKKSDKAGNRFKSKRVDLENMKDFALHGKKDIAWSFKAEFGDKIRKINDMALLPLALTSTITDFGWNSGVKSVSTGENIFSSAGKAVLETSKQFANTKYSRDTAAQMGIFLDDVIITNLDNVRFGETMDAPRGGFKDTISQTIENVKGASSTKEAAREVVQLAGTGIDGLHQITMNATGLPRQSRAFRRGFAKLEAHHMAADIQAKKTWDQVNKGKRSALQKFGINESDWEILSQVELQDVGDGNKLIVPEKIKALSNDLFDGKSRMAREKKRTRLVWNYNSYLEEMAELGSPTPGLKQLFLKSKLDPNTLHGQTWLSGLQYKSFALSMYDTLNFISRNGNDSGKLGNIRQVGSAVIFSSVLGYMNMVSRDILAGRDISDPFDPTVAKDALLRGGGATIIADFLLTDHTKYGSSFTVNALGPTASLIDMTQDAAWDIVTEGKFKKAGKVLERRLTPKLPIAGHMINKYIYRQINDYLN